MLAGFKGCSDRRLNVVFRLRRGILAGYWSDQQGNELQDPVAAFSAGEVDPGDCAHDEPVVQCCAAVGEGANLERTQVSTRDIGAERVGGLYGRT